VAGCWCAGHTGILAVQIDAYGSFQGHANVELASHNPHDWHHPIDPEGPHLGASAARHSAGGPWVGRRGGGTSLSSMHPHHDPT